MPSHAQRALLIAVLIMAAPATGRPQAMPRSDEAAARAVTQEALGIFETVCLASALDGEAVPEVVSRVLAAAAARYDLDPTRQSTEWLVTGQHANYRLTTFEPVGGCAVAATGIDHDAFLNGASQIMARTAKTPGWTATGLPRRSTEMRSSRRVTYVEVSLLRAASPRVLSIIGSASRNAAGLPNHGLISRGLNNEMPPAAR